MGHDPVAVDVPGTQVEGITLAKHLQMVTHQRETTLDHHQACLRLL